jgi:hypothetical protein
MRIRTMALSSALVASTLLAAPTMAGAASPTTDPAPVTTTVPGQAQTPLKYRNTCRPTIAALPSTVEGRPTVGPGAAKGVYIWHERAGWRVRVTHDLAKLEVNGVTKPQLIEVRGRITSTRPFGKVRTIRLEDRQRGEWVSVQRPKRRAMEFRFVNGGFIDGINFTAGCAGKLSFTVWEVTRDATTGTVARTQLPVYVGSTPTLVTSTTSPALAPSPTDASRVVIRRTPVS